MPYIVVIENGYKITHVVVGITYGGSCHIRLKQVKPSLLAVKAVFIIYLKVS